MNSGCIDSIIDTMINSAVNMIPKTITEWEKKRTIHPPTHFYSVISDRDNSKSYKVTYSSSSNAYQCECKAWDNINQEQNQRTCKHIIAIRGENEEKQRITKNKGKWLYKPAKKKPAKKKPEKKVLVLNL